MKAGGGEMVNLESSSTGPPCQRDASSPDPSMFMHGAIAQSQEWSSTMVLLAVAGCRLQLRVLISPNILLLTCRPCVFAYSDSSDRPHSFRNDGCMQVRHRE